MKKNKMNEENNKCPLCHIILNDISNDNKNLNNPINNNILCSTCINKLLKEENNLNIPNDLIENRITEMEEETEIDKTLNRKTENNEIVRHELNKSIIEEIKRDSMNKTLIQGIKQKINQKQILSHINSQKSILNNNLNNSFSNQIKHTKSNKNIQSPENYYIKKTVKANTPTCNIHFLPLDMICLNENIKLCNKCALDKAHWNHEIITDNEFMGYINELNIIYDTMEKNEKMYINCNQKFFKIIENINDKFIKMENQIVEIKKDITNKINHYFIDLLNFINLRRKEIFDKYQYCNYDISDLIKSSSKWMKTVKEDIHDININNLMNSGKQINNRYNIVKEINNMFKILETFKNNGMTIIKNEFWVNPVIIKENKEIIKLLKLTPYEELSNGHNNNNYINENTERKYNSINTENSKIYCKKIIDDKIRHNNTVSDFYKNKNSQKLKSIKSEKEKHIPNTKTNSINFNRISVSKIKNDINNISQSNESTSPFLNSINTKKTLNSGYKEKTKNNNKISEYRKKCESIQVNNDTDKNININFNGHIFNYNSDNNISIIIPEKNKNKNKRNTPQKISIKKKFEKQNLKRCFSFDENTNSENNKNIQIKKKLCLSNNSKVMNDSINNKNSNNISQTSHNENKKICKNEKSFIKKSKTKTSKYNSNYKTLTNKDLEKYIDYQLKKSKQSFNRINLRDNGIKLVCFYYKNYITKIYKEIKMQGCNINDNDIKLLIKCFMENDITVNYLNISDNELTDECIETISNFINSKKDIANISMKNNLFSKKGIKRLKEIVKNKKDKSNEFNIEI